MQYQRRENQVYNEGECVRVNWQYITYPKFSERHGPWCFLRCFLGCVFHDVTSILQGRLNARVVAGYELLLFLAERGVYERVLGFDV
eukprot:g78589.t1